MDMKKTTVSYLDPVLMDSRELEQTQEVRIPDGMPDVDRILGVWGQPILRSKEWRGDTVGFNGGLMLWVMYRPEGENHPQTIDAWVPYQTKWGIPEDSPEGKLNLSMGIRFLDARTISPRKIMVRTGLLLRILALSPREKAVSIPENIPEDVQVLRRSNPMRLYAQAGEKAFALEDSLSSPGEDFGDWKVCAVAVRPLLNDQKVVGNKLAFRGAAELTVLFAADDGEMESRSFVFPFSQFAELDGSFGNDAEADILLCVTNLEMEEDPEGVKQFKLGLTAQFTITDITVLDTIVDAYSNSRAVRPILEELELTPILEKRWESLTGHSELPENLVNSIHSSMWNDCPIFEREGDGGVLRLQGTAQILYKGESGAEGKSLPWEGSKPIKTEAGTQVRVTGHMPGQLQPEPGKNHMELTGEVRCQVTTFATAGMPMVADLELGELRESDPERPSLVLCKAGKNSLWELAKANGSTVDSIRSVNGLENEPGPEQMLLIPIE